MLRPVRSKAIREAEEVGLVDGLKQHPHRLLDDLVFQRRDTQWTCAAIRLRNLHATHRLRVIAAAMHAVLQIHESGVEILAVPCPCLSIHSCCRILLQPLVSLPKQRQLDVAQ
jgi:hypothetical protein